ncbi:MAG: phosphotransferase family protein, partial [Pseudomonadota bacterium]
MDPTDKASQIREGEEINISEIEIFLKDQIPGLTGELTVRQFPSGHSNLTYLLKIGENEFVLRRPPSGTKAKSAHDMGREFRMLKALRPVFPFCPKPLFYTDDTSIIGCPFYIMERMQGIILRRELPAGVELNREQAGLLCEALLDVQVKLHSINYKEVGLGDYGIPEGYARRQVEGWTKRYRAAMTPDAPDFEEGMGWLFGKIPGDSERPAIVHNDFKFDNVVLDPNHPTKIIGVLDWEMATVGDPLMDVGNSLAYWIQLDDPTEMQLVRLMPTHLEGMYSREELIRRYAEKSGREFSHVSFYYCFGLFRLAVIAQQIYYRFYNGQTKDKRFGMLIHGVRALEKAARK